MLCYFLVERLQYFFKNIYFFPHKNMKKPPSKVAHSQPNFFFQYCQPAQNQPKSHFLFHKNDSLRDFYIIILTLVSFCPTIVQCLFFYQSNLIWLLYINFAYSEKATKFEKNLPLKIGHYWVASNFKWIFFFKFCGLLRISELYQQNKHSTQVYIVVSAISANKTYYMMMFLPLRGPHLLDGRAIQTGHHLFHCSHICTMTLNAQLLLCIPTCPCPASQQLGGQSLTTLNKFCPLMTTYLPPIDICD